MANVAVRSSSKASDPVASSITIASPAGTVAGDVMIVCVSGNDVATLADNNGATPFTKDTQQQQTNSGSTLAIFSRRIVSGDPSTWTFTSTAGLTRISAVAITFSNPHATDIYDPSAPSAGTSTQGETSATAARITTTVNNSIHVVCCSTDNQGNELTPPTAGYTEQQQSTEEPCSICTSTINPAGQTSASVVFTPAFSTSLLCQSFAIKNNAGGSSNAAQHDGVFGRLLEGKF